MLCSLNSYMLMIDRNWYFASAFTNEGASKLCISVSGIHQILAEWLKMRGWNSQKKKKENSALVIVF